MLLPWHILPVLPPVQFRPLRCSQLLNTKAVEGFWHPRWRWACLHPQGSPLIKPCCSPFGWLEHQAGSFFCVIRGVVWTFSIECCSFSPIFWKRIEPDYLFRAWLLLVFQLVLSWMKEKLLQNWLYLPLCLWRVYPPWKLSILIKSTHSNETWKNHELPPPAGWLVLVLFGFLTGENESAYPQKAPGLSAPLDHQFPVAPFCFSLFLLLKLLEPGCTILSVSGCFPLLGLYCVCLLCLFFQKEDQKDAEIKTLSEPQLLES